VRLRRPQSHRRRGRSLDAPALTLPLVRSKRFSSARIRRSISAMSAAIARL